MRLTNDNYTPAGSASRQWLHCQMPVRTWSCRLAALRWRGRPWMRAASRRAGTNSARCDSTIRKFTTGYDKWKAYGQAKTVDSLIAVHLDALGASHGVRACAAHPGGIMTEL
jgi:NAD(P)-dependent dehydrogenase (short-subunit alcohol dehydrogenase family)